MAIVPGRLVPAPESPRRRYGLFTAASGPLDLPEHGEGGGVRYVPVTCGLARPYGVTCYEGETSAPVKPLDPDNDLVETGVFVALATLACNAVGYTEEELVAKVRRRLANGEQGAVEEALWTGEDFEGNPLGILNLTEGAETVTVHDELDIAHVVAALEDYAYRVNDYGGVAYIHAPVAVAAHAHEANQIIYDGPLMRTPYGSVWVFGGAYPGTGDAGDEPPAGGAYLHVTGQTTVWRSAEENVYSAFSPTTNERVMVAERAFSVGFDCFNGRAIFDPLGGVS